MAKKIVLQLDPDTEASVEAFLATQVESSRDTLTQAQKVTRVKGRESVEEFILDIVHQALHQVVQQHPTGAIRAKMEQQKALEQEIKAASRATVVAA